jgi:alcohol dehydrogenase-like protein
VGDVVTGDIEGEDGDGSAAQSVALDLSYPESSRAGEMPPPAKSTATPHERGLTMKAIRAHEPTGISGLVYEDAPDPRPMFCEVLVKVAACGITHNELDWPIWTCRAGHQRTSVIPGHEVSGVVAALGFGTAGIAVGDEVFGLTDQLRDGAAAEYVASRPATWLRSRGPSITCTPRRCRGPA